jgi:hypothetical protein
MNSVNTSQNTQANNLTTVQRLTRAITVASGEFSLILACCDSVTKQQEILNLLKEFSTVAIQAIKLAPTDETLYTTITNSIGVCHPEGLIVSGLESVVEINQLLISTNLMRDEFRKNFHFPLVLWVNNEILRKLVWLAPDFKNWASTTIRVDVPENTLIQNQCSNSLTKFNTYSK